jgi:RNA polymerase sigma factor (sigma-70 family)
VGDTVKDRRLTVPNNPPAQSVPAGNAHGHCASGAAGAGSRKRHPHYTGDDAGFRAWATDHAGSMLAEALWRCKDSHRAQDITQDVLEKFFKKWPDEKYRTRIISKRAYVSTAIKYRYFDWLKNVSRTTQREWELPDSESWENPQVCDPDLDLVWDVRNAILQLEDRERLFVYLVYYTDTSLKAAGEMLGMNPTAATRFHKKILAKLRADWDDRSEGDEIA